MKNNKKNVTCFEDEYLTTLLEQVCEVKEVLMDRVEAVAIKVGVIDFYPEGSDKNLAISDAEEAKKILLSAVGSYDDKLNEAHAYYVEHRDAFQRYANFDPSRRYQTSHQVVEIAYYNYHHHNR